MTTIDLNAGLGEGGAFDLELLEVVSSCNIACGGHAGDTSSMLETIRAAKSSSVAIGAHPSYPDVAGFGRRSRFMLGSDLKQSLAEQMDTLQALITDEAAVLSHVKPHGALYNDAADDVSLAAMLVDLVQQRAAAIVGPSGSAIESAAKRAGLTFVAEAFVDRTYLPSGNLVPRAEPHAVHSNLNTITTQAVRIATNGEVTADDGAIISIFADTLCIHGDTVGAGEAARAVREVLLASGVDIRAAT
jgi:UPF0271 protein